MLMAQESQEIDNEDRARAITAYVEGVTHYENGDYELALDQLTAAYLIHTKDAGITYALSEVYRTTGDLTNAAYYGRMSTEMEPENKWYHLNMAEIYRRSGRSEMSLKSLETALEYHPRDVDIFYLLAESYVEFGDLNESNNILDRIMELRGDSFELHLRKFQNYNAMQQTDLALQELEKMRELDPGNVTTLHTISQYYLELGRDEQSKAVLEDAFERHPGNARTLLLLADIYVREQNWEKLGESFLSMIEDPLISPTKKMDLIRFLYMQYQNRPNESMLEEQVEYAVTIVSEMEADYGPAQLFAAEYYLNKQDTDKALQTLERATTIFPDNSEAWSQRLQLLFSQQRYEEVIALADQAEANAPDNAFIRFFAGASHMLLENYQDAEEWLQQATLAPAQRNFRSVIHSTLADVLNELDRWEEAEKTYQTSLRLDRDNHNALNNYAYYLSVRNEKLEEALEMSKRAVVIEPENSSYLDTAGWVYFQLGNVDEAKEYIERSIDAGAESATIFEHMGDIFEALNERSEAIYWWEKAYEIDNNREYLKERLDTGL